MAQKRYKTLKGIYYFPGYPEARSYAEEHGYPTDRIICYTAGWAIQLRVSGPYVGLDIPPSPVVAPHVQRVPEPLDNGYVFMLAPGKPVHISPVTLAEMRAWATDCTWIDQDSLDEYSDGEIITGIQRHYSGGVAQFLADGSPEV